MERGHLRNRRESLNLGMTQLMINVRNANNLLFEVSPISKLFLDDRELSGVCLMFDEEGELIKFCSSYNDVINVALGEVDEYIESYFLIVDEKKPFNNKEVDAIYNNFIHEYISIFNLEEGKIPVEICLN